MSDSNRVGLRYQRSSARVAPVTLSPNSLTALRTTGQPSLGFAPNTIVSNEIQPDAQVADLILVGAQAAGQVAFELSFGAFDDFIESGLRSTWNNTPRRTGTGQITAAGAGTLTVDDDAAFKVNHVVRLVDYGGIDLGAAVYYITVAAANVLTLAPLDANSNAITSGVTIGASTVLSVVGLRAAADGDLDITVSGGVLSVIGPASFFSDAMGATAPLVAGQWVKLSGFNLAANNVWGRIASVAATTITIAAPTGSITETTTGKGIAWFGDYLRNGTVSIPSRQFAIERRYEDHSPVTRELFLGMTVGGLTLDLQPQSIATGQFDLLGFNAKVDDDPAELYGGGTPADVAAPQYSVYNTSSDVGRVGRGASPVDAAGANYVIGATIEVSNNLREQAALGVLGAVAIGAGEFNVSGSLNAYFDNADLLAQLIANAETSFDISMQGGDGRAVLFDLPRIKFNGGAPQVPGKNQDVVIDLGYQAMRSITLGYTLHCQRFHYTQ